jgi:ribonuclease J
MNCMLLETREHIVVVDCGVTFGRREFGENIIHADWQYLLARRDRVRAVVLTHGHEDHLGAVPHLLSELDVPVYAPPYALAQLRLKLSEFELPATDLRTMRVGDPFQVGDFRFEAFSVTHSIPDSRGLIIRTPAGIIVHSGDFKIDRDPPEGESMDLERLREVGEEGVRLLMSDSTNVFRTGSTRGEASVEEALFDLIEDAPGRVVVGQFSSNVYRMRAVLEVAARAGRRVCVFGRSARTHMDLARQMGIIETNPHQLVDPSEASDVPRHKLLVIATGTQGEPNAALGRFARREMRDLDLEEGDEIILSSRVIPGHEVSVYDIIGDFERMGIVVHHQAVAPEVHVSGHACQEEQALLMRLVKPEAFIPVHGTISHLQHHAELAERTGVKETLVAENGDVVQMTAKRIEIIGQVRSGRVYRRGLRVLAPEVRKDRGLMAELGLVVAALPVERGRLVADPRVYARGVVVLDQAEKLLLDAGERLGDKLANEHGKFFDDDVEDTIERARRELRRFFARRVGYKPLITVMLVPLD